MVEQTRLNGQGKLHILAQMQATFSAAKILVSLTYRVKKISYYGVGQKKQSYKLAYIFGILHIQA